MDALKQQMKILEFSKYPEYSCMSAFGYLQWEFTGIHLISANNTNNSWKGENRKVN